MPALGRRGAGVRHLDDAHVAGGSHAWRRRQLRGLLRLLDEHEAELVAAGVSDLPRDPDVVWLTEIAPVRAEVVHALRHLNAWMRPTRSRVPVYLQPGSARSVPVPLGTVLVISPWNYPLQLTLAPLVASIAAGNRTILKLSEHAPATAAVLETLLPEHLDGDAVSIVHGGPSVVEDIVKDGVDHIFFTGGTSGGRAVLALAAERLISVTLELGGKSPVVVSRTADLELAARRIAWGKCLNGGQTCVAPDHALVDRAVVERFTELVCREMREAPVGAALPSDAHVQRVRELLADHGGAVELGGSVDPISRRVEATVVSEPSPSSRLANEEIFAPILPIHAVDDVDDAIRRINAGPEPLAAYLFSGDRDERRRFVATCRAGGICLNHVVYQVVVPSLPFGGRGASGMGSYHGRAGFEALSHRVSVHRRPAWLDLAIHYPPLTPRKRRLIELMMRLTQVGVRR